MSVILAMFIHYNVITNLPITNAQDFLFSKRDTNRAFVRLSILFENTWPTRISPGTWQINVSTLVTANVYIFAYDSWRTLDAALNRLTIHDTNSCSPVTSENDKKKN